MFGLLLSADSTAVYGGLSDGRCTRPRLQPRGFARAGKSGLETENALYALGHAKHRRIRNRTQKPETMFDSGT